MFIFPSHPFFFLFWLIKLERRSIKIRIYGYQSRREKKKTNASQLYYGIRTRPPFFFSFLLRERIKNRCLPNYSISLFLSLFFFFLLKWRAIRIIMTFILLFFFYYYLLSHGITVGRSHKECINQ